MNRSMQAKNAKAKRDAIQARKERDAIEVVANRILGINLHPYDEIKPPHGVSATTWEWFAKQKARLYNE